MSKICVIGAGPCGITAAKNLLQQGIHTFTVFEQGNQLGGNWVYDEHHTHSSVYETTHLISSKKLSSFEDFPMPDDYPDYPSHKQVLAYFQAYAEHFGILPFICFNTCVLKVTPCGDRQWCVAYENKQGKHEDIFDYVLVANGHHWSPLTPDYPGIFDGEVLHAHQYKKAAPFKNKRVLVIGGGNSACDIAVEIAQVSGHASISMRHGQHIFPKFIFGKPTDIAFSTIHRLPFSWRQWIAKWVIRIIQGRYAKYKLARPDTKTLATHPTINSQLLYFIRHGKITTQVGIQRFEKDRVYFTNGQWDYFDTVIFATGYHIQFPFFDSQLIDYQSAQEVPLYLKMMHPQWSTLYFIGLFQPQGCIWPLADHQSHIIARIIAGKLNRPANVHSKIEKEINKAHRYFKKSSRHVLEVDYHNFRKELLNELAS